MSKKVYAKKTISSDFIGLQVLLKGKILLLITYICAVTLFKAFEHIYLVVLVSEIRPGPQVKILFSFLILLKMEFIMLINDKLPTF